MIMGSLTWLSNNKKNYSKMFDFQKNQGNSFIRHQPIEDLDLSKKSPILKPKRKMPSWLTSSNKNKKILNFEKNKQCQDEKFEHEFKQLQSRIINFKTKPTQNKNKVKKDKLIINYEDIEDIINKKINKKGLSNDQMKNPNFKIIYCTRTHSQITEFINEIKKTKFATEFKVVHLSSRRHSCVNPSLNKYKNGNSLLLKEKCQDLRESSAKCSYYDSIDINNAKRIIYVIYFVLYLRIK